MAMRNDGDYWHEDLVIEILLRLPVKSIIRFKSLSRTWHHHIKNPTFVSQHLALSKRNTRLLVRYNDGPNCRNVVVPLVDDQETYHIANSSCGLLLQPPYHIAKRAAYHHGFLVDNGLVCFCFAGSPYRMTLWNPATREYRNLPQCSNYIPASARRCSGPLLGFGLDPISNDYKVVTIQKYYTCQMQLETAGAVYKMSTDSWRVMNEEDVYTFRDMVTYDLIYYRACANGVFYWLAIKTSYLGWEPIEILAFRFGDEKFQLIQLPPGISYGDLLDFHDDRISLWSIDKLKDDQTYEIWMLNGEGHWTKQLRIECLPRVSRLLCVWKKGKVFVSSVDGDLWLWDIDAKECIDIGKGIKPGHKWWLLPHICLYEESLVSIRRE